MSRPDEHFMARAVNLARRGLFTTDPNPRVGCVLVRDGGIVGEGYHYRAGEPHAEPNALAVAGARAAGATAYVTLEPCCHQGRTPPCTEALIEAGVSEVVIGVTDPNPLVAGKGIRRLRDAGIRVTTGLLENEIQDLNPGFTRRMKTGRPYVRCKLAMSLDGRTAMASGESRWITGEAARLDVQRLRARSSAIVTGIGTVLADDPSLNVRAPLSAFSGVRQASDLRQPLRVILDPGLETPPRARMLALPGETLIVTSRGDDVTKERLMRRGAEVALLEGGAAAIDLQALLDYLGGRDINELLIEAGPTLAGAALQAGVVDELVIYVAPHLMGSEARGLFNMPGLERMRDRIDLNLVDIRAVGEDIRITARPVGATTEASGAGP